MRRSIATLVLAVAFALSPSFASAQEFNCPEHATHPATRPANTGMLRTATGCISGLVPAATSGGFETNKDRCESTGKTFSKLTVDSRLAKISLLPRGFESERDNFST
jgi:hypothetical protein